MPTLVRMSAAMPLIIGPVAASAARGINARGKTTVIKPPIIGSKLHND
jgi:hypothetical protein